jgi:hypothetical protein
MDRMVLLEFLLAVIHGVTMLSLCGAGNIGDMNVSIEQSKRKKSSKAIINADNHACITHM